MEQQIKQPKSMQHRIFRADTKLSSNEINNLLGIRVMVPSGSLSTRSKHCVVDSCNRMLRFAIITLVLSSVALMGSMYQLKIGPFFESGVYASANY